jgi:wyosine [tRNA(Phe)-imidazoG37] synthetase (radical SAM superfamily)
MSSLPIITPSDSASRRAFTLHERTWQHNLYVYPVVSRRSKGISIGINLNPDKVCNFDCIYCSVDRTIAPQTKSVDLPRLREELHAMVDLARSGHIYQFDPFDKIPESLRRINDIAFSGDGEPTTFPEFLDSCRIAIDIKTAAQLPQVKIVVITNATMLHRPHVQQALALLDANNGEIWAKLDAGTPEYYQLVDRTTVPFTRILDNILQCARTRPTVIQSLFMKVHGTGPTPAEITAYAQRLAHILSAGGQLKLIQIYTVARHTTETYATPLFADELSHIAQVVTHHVPNIAIEIYP